MIIETGKVTSDTVYKDIREIAIGDCFMEQHCNIPFIKVSTDHVFQPGNNKIVNLCGFRKVRVVPAKLVIEP